MRAAPCRGCGHRQVMCHAECGEYKSWAAERVEISNARAAFRESRAWSIKKENTFRDWTSSRTDKWRK